jgi:hypothetical protein
VGFEQKSALLDPKAYQSLSGPEAIRFSEANDGVYFGKNSRNICILLRIFPLYSLAVCSLKTALHLTMKQLLMDLDGARCRQVLTWQGERQTETRELLIVRLVASDLLRLSVEREQAAVEKSDQNEEIRRISTLKLSQIRFLSFVTDFLCDHFGFFRSRQM